MPRARRGPSGPKSSLAGKSGTNKKTPHRNAGTSGPPKSNMTKPAPGTYSKKGY